MWGMFFLSNSMTWRWKSCGWLIAILISGGAAGCGEQVIDAPPAKVAFENSWFRIFDVNVPPGTTLQHSYQNGAVMVVMTDGSRIRVRPSGGSWGAEIAPAAGNITIANAGEHGVRNAGEGGFQLLALENLRPGGGSAGTPSVANGMTLAGESSSFRVYEAQLGDGNTQISHIHASPALAILIRGTVLSQGPENKDTTIGEVSSGLKQLDRPGQWLFVPPGEAHYVVRLGADPAHIVEVELR
jgi:quercetin dioxygenase-like cupin family protein